MSTFHKLSLLISLAENGSVRRAAKARGLSASVVAGHVAEFEEWLGEHCLVPERRYARLTPIGEQVLGLGRQIEAAQHELARMAGGAGQCTRAPSLAQLRTLQAFARHQTLTRASERLNITQAAATRRLQALQAQLGAVLLVTEGRLLRLTPTGTAILRPAEAALACWSRIEALRRGARPASLLLEVGLTELTALTWFPALIAEIRRLLPQLSLHPDVDHGTPLARRLLANQLDAAILPRRMAPPALISLPLGSVPFAWLARPDVLPSGRVLSVAELASVPLLVQGRGSGINRELEALFAGQQVQPVRSFASNHLSALGGFLEAGLGAACLPRSLFVNQLLDGRLVELTTDIAAPSVEYCLVLRHGASHLGELIAPIARAAFPWSD